MLTGTPREERAKAEAKSVRDRAWEIDRTDSEGCDDPWADRRKELKAAIELAKQVQADEVVEAISAHDILSKFLRRDMAEVGFVDPTYARLLKALYEYLDSMTLQYRGQKWGIGPNTSLEVAHQVDRMKPLRKKGAANAA